jgi:hypothetical protein
VPEEFLDGPDIIALLGVAGSRNDAERVRHLMRLLSPTDRPAWLTTFYKALRLV